MESVMPKQKRRHFDSREAVEVTMLGRLGGFTLRSRFYFHVNLWEAEVEVTGLTPC